MTILNALSAETTAPTRPSTASAAGDESAVDAFAAIMSAAAADLAEHDAAETDTALVPPSRDEIVDARQFSLRAAPPALELQSERDGDLEVVLTDGASPVPADDAPTRAEQDVLDDAVPVSAHAGSPPSGDDAKPVAPDTGDTPRTTWRHGDVAATLSPAPAAPAATEPAGTRTSAPDRSPVAAPVAPVPTTAPVAHPDAPTSSGPLAHATPHAAAPQSHSTPAGGAPAPVESITTAPIAPPTPPMTSTIAPAPPAASALSSPAPVPFTTQVLTPVVSLARAPQGDHTVTVTVTPENLGPVTVRAHVGADGVRVELFAPLDVGRDALRAILPDLRRDLAATGLHAQLDVSERSEPDAHDSPREEPRRHRARDVDGPPVTRDVPRRGEPATAGPLSSILDTVV